MDLTVILALVSGLIIIILISFVLWKHKDEEEKKPAEPGERTTAARNARARMRAAEEAEDEEGEPEKMGAKKRAKLEAKAEKKVQREAEERDREEKKKRKEQQEVERKRQEERLEVEEARREEEERKAEEERVRREHEEYLQMKAAFSIEEEGFDEDETDQQQTIQQFIGYIKTNKVVVLEDLAAEFSLRTQAGIDRIKDLQSTGQLTGVIDDRGKFIYISQDELEAVAKFVKQRGRVSISELAENSQRLINLNANPVAT